MVAFRDIHPRAPTHLLIVPDQADPHPNDVTAPMTRRCSATCSRVAAELARREGIADNGYRLIVNCNQHGGQEVYHLHFHLLGGKPLGPMVSV